MLATNWHVKVYGNTSIIEPSIEYIPYPALILFGFLIVGACCLGLRTQKGKAHPAVRRYLGAAGPTVLFDLAKVDREGELQNELVLGL